MDQENRLVNIGGYLFSRETFQELVLYVWRGGYPRWKEEVRPLYVLEMKKEIEKSQNWIFNNIQFSHPIPFSP